MIYLVTALIFIIVTPYILYPVFVWSIANLLSEKAPSFKSADDTQINVLITVHNGEKNIEEMGQEIFEYFLACASGEKTKSEVLNLGRHEFAPWQIGITG